MTIKSRVECSEAYLQGAQTWAAFPVDIVMEEFSEAIERTARKKRV
jgi:hypothetical protein